MDALGLIALAVWSFIVSFAGGLVGMVLGNLRLPLVVLLGSSAAAAGGANVAISGAAAISSTVAHTRAGRVSWRLFKLMALPSLAGALIGGFVAGELPNRILLAAISVVIFYGAWEVLKWEPRKESDPEPAPPSRRDALISAVGVGFGVGLLGGFVGLILGTLRLPAMVRYLGVNPYAAVGTNAAVGAVVGVGGLLGHLPNGVDWDLLAVGVLGAVPAAYLGAHYTGRLNEKTLMRAVAAVLVISATSMAINAAIG
jgi:uncharacterized membrane protein YfcA